jgi:hypothetical protein
MHGRLRRLLLSADAGPVRPDAPRAGRRPPRHGLGEIPPLLADDAYRAVFSPSRDFEADEDQNGEADFATAPAVGLPAPLSAPIQERTVRGPKPASHILKWKTNFSRVQQFASTHFGALPPHHLNTAEYPKTGAFVRACRAAYRRISCGQRLDCWFKPLELNMFHALQADWWKNMKWEKDFLSLHEFLAAGNTATTITPSLYWFISSCSSKLRWSNDYKDKARWTRLCNMLQHFRYYGLHHDGAPRRLPTRWGVADVPAQAMMPLV